MMTSETSRLPLVPVRAAVRGRKDRPKMTFSLFTLFFSLLLFAFFPLHLPPLQPRSTPLSIGFDSTTMSTPQVVNVTLPALPQGWSADKDFKAVGTLSAGTQRTVEPVGPHFLAHARRVCPFYSCKIKASDFEERLTTA